MIDWFKAIKKANTYKARHKSTRRWELSLESIKSFMAL